MVRATSKSHSVSGRVAHVAPIELDAKRRDLGLTVLAVLQHHETGCTEFRGRSDASCDKLRIGRRAVANEGHSSNEEATTVDPATG